MNQTLNKTEEVLFFPNALLLNAIVRMLHWCVLGCFWKEVLE